MTRASAKKVALGEARRWHTLNKMVNYASMYGGGLPQNVLDVDYEDNSPGPQPTQSKFNLRLQAVVLLAQILVVVFLAVFIQIVDKKAITPSEIDWTWPSGACGILVLLWFKRRS